MEEPWLPVAAWMSFTSKDWVNEARQKKFHMLYYMIYTKFKIRQRCGFGSQNGAELRGRGQRVTWRRPKGFRVW